MTQTRPSLIGPGAVDGVLVGHHQRIGRGWLTGTTVILAPTGATCGVDVRGGGPGTRETDLLRPENLVQQVHAICLTGGSAYGLAAADGVMTWCEEHRLGFPVGSDPTAVVPIVPSAVIFDLGRGGRFANRPGADFGRRAAAAARPHRAGSGNLGAGAGAVAGGLKGGVGNSLRILEDGTRVAALAVVNAAGSLIDPRSGLPWRTSATLRRPDAADRRRLADAMERRSRPLNTTIGVVVTDARLSKAECTKLAQVAHDGLARAANPSHLLVDGDTIFALSTGRSPLTLDAQDAEFGAQQARPAFIDRILAAGADAFADACVDAVLSAESAAQWPSYRELCPSAFRRS